MSLNASWWCYAVESWVQTANCRPHANEMRDDQNTSSVELVTGIPPDVSNQFQFPFGCPVSSIDPTGREARFDPITEFGIAVGTTSTQNGSTLVLLPKRGIKPFERADVKSILLPPTEIQTQRAAQEIAQRHPIITQDGSIIFQSPTVEMDQADMMTPGATLGTLGTNMLNLIAKPLKDAPTRTINGNGNKRQGS